MTSSATNRRHWADRNNRRRAFENLPDLLATHDREDGERSTYIPAEEAIRQLTESAQQIAVRVGRPETDRSDR